MSSFQKAFSNTMDIYLGRFCAHEEEPDEITIILRFPDKIELFIRREYGLKDKILLFFQTFISLGSSKLRSFQYGFLGIPVTEAVLCYGVRIDV